MISLGHVIVKASNRFNLNLILGAQSLIAYCLTHENYAFGLFESVKNFTFI